MPEVAELGLGDAAARARSKLVESLPDPVRATVQRLADRVHFDVGSVRDDPDPRVRAVADAIRGRRVIRLDSRSRSPVVVHPVRLLRSADGWAVVDERTPETAVPQHLWGTINVSALAF